MRRSLLAKWKVHVLLASLVDGLICCLGNGTNTIDGNKCGVAPYAVSSGSNSRCDDAHVTDRKPVVRPVPTEILEVM